MKLEAINLRLTIDKINFFQRLYTLQLYKQQIPSSLCFLDFFKSNHSYLSHPVSSYYCFFFPPISFDPCLSSTHVFPPRAHPLASSPEPVEFQPCLLVVHAIRIERVCPPVKSYSTD